MRFAWEVRGKNRLSGPYVPLDPPWFGEDDAGCAQEVADRIRPQMLPYQLLYVRDPWGVDLTMVFGDPSEDTPRLFRS